jgi:hypothetical protein
MNIQIKIGIAFIIFGVLIGGTGLASAGVGISIPMMPIGIYLIIRGYKTDEHKKEQSKTKEHIEVNEFEKTKLGKILLGILLIIIGIGTSSLIIGIPIGLIGLYLILS